jgi:hypothetical protein
MNIEQLNNQYIDGDNLQSPYTLTVDLSTIPVGALASSLMPNLTEQAVSPVTDILGYYGLQEVMDLVLVKNQNVLPPEYLKVFEAYNKKTEDVSKKLITYQLLSYLIDAKSCDDFGSYRNLLEEHKYYGNEEGSPETERLKKDNQALMEKRKKKKAKELYNSYEMQHPRGEPLLSKEKFSQVFSLCFEISCIPQYEGDYPQRILNKLQEEDYKELTALELVQGVQAFFSGNPHMFNYYNKVDRYKELTKLVSEFLEGKINTHDYIKKSFDYQIKQGHFNKEVIYNESHTKRIYTFDISSSSFYNNTFSNTDL